MSTEPDIADRVLSMAELPCSQSVVTPTGRRIDVESGSTDRLTIRNPAGAIELQVVLTDAGPVLRFSAAAIDLASAGDIRLACRKLEVDASERIALSSQGEARVDAGRVNVRGHDGDVHLLAAGDLRLDGERVLLNC